MEKHIKQWKELTNKITESWIREYFEIEKDETIYFDWVDIGGVFSFADYWFSFYDVLECYRLYISKKDLFNWYDWCMDNHSVKLSLSQYVLSPQERLEQEEKHLLELEQRVKSAEKEFKEAIKRYGK
jgi:hypothetical protein